jgi:hypothetical protein
MAREWFVDIGFGDWRPATSNGLRHFIILKIASLELYPQIRNQ